MGDIRADVRDLGLIINALNSATAAARRDMRKLQDQVMKEEGTRRKITDHAIVRFLERHKGLDIEALKMEIDAMVSASEPFAKVDGHWHADTGLVFILDGPAVLTVLSPEQSEKYLGRRLEGGGRSSAQFPLSNAQIEHEQNGTD